MLEAQGSSNCSTDVQSDLLPSLLSAVWGLQPKGILRDYVGQRGTPSVLWAAETIEAFGLKRMPLPAK